MSPSWRALHAQFLDHTLRRSFLDQYLALRRAAPCLARHHDPAALLDWFHSRGDPDEKNKALRALVHLAQQENGEAVVAKELIILALWPGIDAVGGRLRRFHEPSVLHAELVHGIACAIATLNLARVNAIAATLLRNLERDLKRRAIRELVMTASAVVFDDDQDLTTEEAAIHDPLLTRHVAQALSSLRGQDAALVLAVAVEGLSQREVAERFGIGHEAARKRYCRALARLRQDLVER